MRPTRLLWTTLFAVILAGGILLVLANPEPITVELYFTQFTYPAGLVLLLTLLAGIGVCVLLGEQLSYTIGTGLRDCRRCPIPPRKRYRTCGG